MSAHRLDISAYSTSGGRTRSWRRCWTEAELVGVPTIALGNLRTGFLLDGRRQHNETVLEAFLDNPAVEVLPGISLNGWA